MLTVLRGGNVYAPEPLGQQDLVLAGERILHVGRVDVGALEASGAAVDVMDVTDALIVPGLIDAHEHLIGGSGERGFATLTPEIAFSELVEAGITTVVGCLGVDTTTRTMEALTAKVKGLNAEGVTAYAYTGGYDVPPVTLTGCVRRDLLFVNEIIAVGETAISDRRSTAPSIGELARLVHEAYVGGLLAGKCGVTHFHVGDAPSRLAPLRALLDDYSIDPSLLYPTHVERNEALMAEAVELTQRGVTVDVDVVEHDLARWIRFFVDHDGDLARLTVTSDAAVQSPGNLLEQCRSCMRDEHFELAEILPLVTTNPARVLGLTKKGRLAPGCDADVLALEPASLDVTTVIARGVTQLRDGRLQKREAFLRDSNRRIILHGEKS